MNRLLTAFAAMAACSPSEPVFTEDSGVDGGPVPWTAELPSAGTAIADVRGYTHRRAVFHLHSPWSHDACDGHGWEEGVKDEACLADLRGALCTTRFDAAFVTDHPSHGAEQSWEQIFHPQEGDSWVMGEADERRALLIPCDDGHTVAWRAGFEDELMPVGMVRHVDPDPSVRDAILNRADADSLASMQAAGARVLLAHTEGRELTHLETLQDAGLHGVEAFNVHAMFAPDIRQEDLGLDGLGWITEIGPFTSEDATAEPDLLFLAVHQEQLPSIERWDALLQRGPMMATAGTDAHQNVLPLEVRDGERVDAFRRMLRWFSTMLRATEGSVDGDDEALDARRAFIVFEVFGTPTGFDFVLEADGQSYEMGADAPSGQLTLACPELSPTSPRGDELPEITATVFKDGLAWQTGCGSWPTDGAGVYRARVDVVPNHLREFLGDDPEPFLHAYPWIYSGAVRVGL